MMKNCWSKKKFEESNARTLNQKKDSDKEWKVKASVAIEEEELALIVTIPGQINYNSD